jgi:hypothetical protein
MSITLNISEEITEYTDNIDKSLTQIETELNNIKIVLTPISKTQTNKIEKLIKDSDNNV